MPLTRQQTDLLLADLERRIKQRDGWSDWAAFYREVEYDLRPILDTAADPGHVHAWIEAKFLRNGRAVGLPC